MSAKGVYHTRAWPHQLSVDIIHIWPHSYVGLFVCLFCFVSVNE